MIEWAIAITALCGAISGGALLYIGLRTALEAQAERTAMPKSVGVSRVRLGRVSTQLPRATVHRVSPLLGTRCGHRLARLRA